MVIGKKLKKGKINYDYENDILFLYIGDKNYLESIECGDIILDINKKKRNFKYRN